MTFHSPRPLIHPVPHSTTSSTEGWLLFIFPVSSTPCRSFSIPLMSNAECSAGPLTPRSPRRLSARHRKSISGTRFKPSTFVWRRHSRCLRVGGFWTVRLMLAGVAIGGTRTAMQAVGFSACRTQRACSTDACLQPRYNLQSVERTLRGFELGGPRAIVRQWKLLLRGCVWVQFGSQEPTHSNINRRVPLTLLGNLAPKFSHMHTMGLVGLLEPTEL